MNEAKRQKLVAQNAADRRALEVALETSGLPVTKVSKALDVHERVYFVGLEGSDATLRVDFYEGDAEWPAGVYLDTEWHPLAAVALARAFEVDAHLVHSDSGVLTVAEVYETVGDMHLERMWADADFESATGYEASVDGHDPEQCPYCGGWLQVGHEIDWLNFRNHACYGIKGENYDAYRLG